MSASLPIPLFKVFMPEHAQSALQPVLHSGRLACGPQVAAFEAQCASWLGLPDAVALSDASSALMLALFAAGVRPGDEVIVPALACSASIMPIANLFAHPVWCDVDPDTGMATADNIAGLISDKTKAILICDWSGDVAKLDETLSLARQHGLKVIEDATEAFGAERNGRRLGNLGNAADFTVYSFYASKHINTGGEGALLLASDPIEQKRVRHLRRFGFEPSALRLPNGDLNPQFDIPLAGFNIPMNEIAATIGLAALPDADRIVDTHRRNGRYYEAAFAQANVTGLRQLKRDERSVSAYWTYSMLAERRDDLIHKLISNGIGAQRLHVRNDGFSCFSQGRADLPGTASFDSHNISIPCGWWMGEQELERVVQCIGSGW
ncbi:MAG TPA: DegT/DnrJ/EryC1/StrS family aminotransferase [Burkholderiaceae bacterium]|nr:DegT/DnrJ/EryC1/StrS family aminotransferase [Burkholderiaceae bacterium]